MSLPLPILELPRSPRSSATSSLSFFDGDLTGRFQRLVEYPTTENPESGHYQRLPAQASQKRSVRDGGSSRPRKRDSRVNGGLRNLFVDWLHHHSPFI